MRMLGTYASDYPQVKAKFHIPHATGGASFHPDVRA